MTEPHDPTPTPDLAPELPPLDTSASAPIARCACGVPLGTAHYCAARDHNWVKAPEPLEDDGSRQGAED
jgi:hypothetical protein